MLPTDSRLQRSAPDGAGGGGIPPVSAPTGQPPAAGAVPPVGTAVPRVPEAPVAPATWEDALALLPEEQKVLYEQHTAGLKNTVQATRQERDDLQKSLREITTALGKDPAAAAKLLDEMSTQLELATRRAEFVEQAVRPEIGCTNPGAAFAIAQAQGLFDARGNLNWDTLRAAVPELFRKPAPPAGNAGVGTGVAPPGKRSMDDIIRAKMGV